MGLSTYTLVAVLLILAVLPTLSPRLRRAYGPVIRTGIVLAGLAVAVALIATLFGLPD